MRVNIKIKGEKIMSTIHFTCSCGMKITRIIIGLEEIHLKCPGCGKIFFRRFDQEAESYEILEDLNE